MGDGADGVEVGVGFGPRVLLGDLGAELDVGADRLAEWVVVGEAGFVERLEVEGDEAVALLVCDLEMAVHVDDVLEAERFGEAASGRRTTRP